MKINRMAVATFLISGALACRGAVPASTQPAGMEVSTAPATEAQPFWIDFRNPADEPPAQREWRVAQIRSQIIEADRRVKNDQATINGAYQQLRAHGFAASEDALNAANRQVCGDLDKLSLEAAGDKARLGAIETQIVVLRNRARESADVDPAVRALDEVVKVRQKQLNSIIALNAQGAAPAANLNNAQIALAEAQAAAAVQRERAIAAAGGDTVGSLNVDLTKLSIDQADRNARISVLNERRQAMQDMFAQLDFAGRLNDEINSINSWLMWAHSALPKDDGNGQGK